MPKENPKISLPNHIGFILDGNRRWATEKNLPAVKGHHQGAEVFLKIALASINVGVKYVSAFMFSTENWNRSKSEINYLLKLMVKSFEHYIDEINKNDIKVMHIGSRDGLPKSVLQAIDKSVKVTENNTRGTIFMCINYGGQQEIVDAAKKLLRHNPDPKRLSVREFEKYFYIPDTPPVDLVVRTSGEYRTSGFMLWHAAYAEYVFIDKYWPDFTKQDLKFVLLYYAKRHRRFGK